MREKTTGNIISDWQDHYPELFSKHSLKLRHTLHRSKLFTDKALVELLENAPRKNYNVTTMDKREHSPTIKREGQFGDLSGKQILQAVKKGSIWINFQDPHEIKSEYGDLLADMYAEFEARVPGLKTFKHKMAILISSPNLKVKYHFDIPGQTLWQIRGHKRVYVYPPTAPFLSQNELEKVVINEAHETDLKYQPWFDDHAEIYELQAGDMVHWPLNHPHRVENHDDLNISIATEHWTSELRKSYAVNYANGMMRKVGLNHLSMATDTAGFYPKAALAAGVKLSGIQKRNAKPFHIDFEVDPKSPDCVRDIEPFEHRN